MVATARPLSSPAPAHRREALILNHLGLVRHILGRLLVSLPAGVDRENLEAAGVLGLVEAAGKFDSRRGVQFKTFAYIRIRGAILDELRRNNPLPQHMVEQLARVRQASAQFGSAAPTVEALAAATGLTVEEVGDCLAAQRLTQAGPWQEAVGSGGRCQPGAESQAEREETRELLACALADLPERDRLVVTLYYLEDLRLKEIGAVLGLSESRVSRLLSASLQQLRATLADKIVAA